MESHDDCTAQAAGHPACSHEAVSHLAPRPLQEAETVVSICSQDCVLHQAGLIPLLAGIKQQHRAAGAPQDQRRAEACRPRACAAGRSRVQRRRCGAETQVHAGRRQCWAVTASCTSSDAGSDMQCSALLGLCCWALVAAAAGTPTMMQSQVSCLSSECPFCPVWSVVATRPGMVAARGGCWAWVLSEPVPGGCKGFLFEGGGVAACQPSATLLQPQL